MSGNTEAEAEAAARQQAVSARLLAIISVASASEEGVEAVRRAGVRVAGVVAVHESLQWRWSAWSST